MNSGDEFTLELNNASGKVTWKSSNTKVVKVKNGVVTAVGAGTATITATNNGTKYKCKVTVAGEVGLNYTEKTIKVGETLKLKVSGANAISFTSSNGTVYTRVKDGGSEHIKEAQDATIYNNVYSTDGTLKEHHEDMDNRVMSRHLDIYYTLKDGNVSVLESLYDMTQKNLNRRTRNYHYQHDGIIKNENESIDLTDNTVISGTYNDIQLDRHNNVVSQNIRHVSKSLSGYSENNHLVSREYSYNSDGNVSKIISKNKNSNSLSGQKDDKHESENTSITEYEYNYNSLGQIEKRISKNGNGTLTGWTEYYYDIAGRVTKEISMGLSDGTTEDYRENSRTEYFYDFLEIW